MTNEILLALVISHLSAMSVGACIGVAAMALMYMGRDKHED